MFRLGAQVFIEPGQDKVRVEKWFESLAQHGMSTTRIRMFEDHIRKGDQWDYKIYDFAFDMAAKYNIKVLATIFPSDNSVGGFKFPRDEDHLKQIEKYIENLVKHFKNHPALDCWVLQNEPGVEERINEGLAPIKYQEWLRNAKNNDQHNLSGWENIQWEMFFKDFTTWYLQWIADQVKCHDQKSLIHVNNHQLFSNLSQYDFKHWMSFISTLGVSIHPSWHLRYFTRKQHTMAISAHCEVIRQASLPKPFWITELQGGNNIFSGYQPMGIYASDIAQWVWTGIMSGAERIIFWTLNPRAQGDEAGEWSMVTYQDEPTDRLIMSKEITKVVSDHQEFFENSEPIKPIVSLLYSLESMITLEKVMSNGFDDTYKGRKEGAHILSVLAFYETLMELGIPCEIININDFNWSQHDTDQTVILANTVALSTKTLNNIHDFTESGNHLIMTGMTGFFDEHMQNIHQKKSPFKNLTGAELKEFDFIGESKEMDVDGLKLPIHMLIGELKNYTGEVISKVNDKITGVRNTYGKGRVTWIPSLIGLGSWQNDNTPLANLLQIELNDNLSKQPFYFKKHMPGVLMKTIELEKDYITMIVNNNKQQIEVPIKIPIDKTPKLLFGESKQIGENTIVSPGDTLIIKWS
jgi:beta-galactosidase